MSTTQLAMAKLVQVQALLGEARQYEQNAGHQTRAQGISNLMASTAALANAVINTEVDPPMSAARRAAVDLHRSGVERLQRLRESRGEVS